MGSHAKNPYRAFIICLFLMAPLACDAPKSTSSSAAAAGINAALTSCSVSGGTSTTSCQTNTGTGASAVIDPYGDANQDEAPPDFSTANLGTDFNRDKVSNYQVPAAYKNTKAFVVQRTGYYRPIWLDLTNNSAYNIFPSNSWLNKLFTTESFDQHVVKNISMHQPLSSSALVNYDRGDEFYVIGHAFSTALAYPSCPTAVLSLYAPNSTDSLVNSDPTALAIPIDYKRIYYKMGTNNSQWIADCQTEQNAQAAGQQASDVKNDQACALISAGTDFKGTLSDAQNGGDGEASMQSFYNEQNVVVWEGVPPPGYHCMGHIVTNSETPPLLSIDGAGTTAQPRVTNFGVVVSSTQNADGTTTNVYNEAAMYCIKEKYLLPGALVPIFADNDIVVSLIVPQNGNGGGWNGAYMFHVYQKNGETTAQATADLAAMQNSMLKGKIWVLNSSYVVFEGDDMPDNPNSVGSCPFSNPASPANAPPPPPPATSTATSTSTSTQTNTSTGS